MYISTYVCKTCLKELVILLKYSEIIEQLLHPVRFLKILLFRKYFLPYFKNKYFIVHLPTLASGNVTLYAVIHLHEQYINVLVYNDISQ